MQSAEIPAAVGAAQVRVLLGLLCQDMDMASATYISIEGGEWILATMTEIDGQMVQETFVRHEDWNQFIRLCADYSDTVEGDL